MSPCQNGLNDSEMRLIKENNLIVLNVTYKCLPGKRDAFLEAIKKEGIDAASRVAETAIERFEV